VTPDDAAFWAAIEDRPRDSLPVGIFADWLAENGQPVRAAALHWLFARHDRVLHPVCIDGHDDGGPCNCTPVTVTYRRLPSSVYRRLRLRCNSDSAVHRSDSRITRDLWANRAGFLVDFVDAWLRAVAAGIDPASPAECNWCYGRGCSACAQARMGAGKP
jgi:uncharacterized protein (TIGR02996 family)